MIVSPNQSAIQAVLRSFLLSVLPANTPVIAGQDNRVPEPQGADFVVFWTTRRDRIETNVDTYADCLFTGSISGNILTVSNVNYGSLAVGSQVFGVGVTVPTTITALSGGTGGVGNYMVSTIQVVGSEFMAAGTENLLQPTQITFQLDVHGPNSHDNAQIISTAFRDDFAVEAFAALNSNVYPLYADDPRQVPFINAEEQYETRYIIEALVQANQIVGIPQQFADSVSVTLVDIP